MKTPKRPRTAVRRLLAPFLAALTVVGALTFTPASAEDDPPEALERWKITQQVINDSPFRLELVMSHLTELTQWIDSPAATILPGARNVMSFYTDESGHGLVGIVVYAAYDTATGDLMGMVSPRSGIDCNTPTPVACLSFHRWEMFVCDRGGAVRGLWTDNDGSPTNFWTEMRVVDGRRGSGACLGGFGDEPGEQPAVDPDQPNAPWGVTATLENQSAYDMRFRNLWNSESSNFVKGPPNQVDSGHSSAPAWMYVNLAGGHGPDAVVWYDLFQPGTSNYVGSAVLQASVDCVATYVTEGCLSARTRYDATARVKAGHRISAETSGFGLPPLALNVDYEILGGPSGVGSSPMDPPVDTTSTTASAGGSGSKPAPLTPAYTG